MKILIVGDPNLIWNYKYIKNVLCGTDHDISVLYYGPIKEGYLKFYNENNIRICVKIPGLIPLSLHRSISSILRRCYLIWARIMKKYDCIHLQYVTKKSLAIANLAVRTNVRFIATPWGSDFLRADPEELKQNEKYLDKVDKITVASDKMLLTLQEAYGSKYDNKYVSFLKLGLDIFESLESTINKYSIRECKEHFKLDVSKISVGIGYNGSAAQQHIKVLNVISKFPKEIKEKIELIFHVSYALPSMEYKDEIRRKAIECGCEFHIIEDYLYNEEMAQLRNATDIFVHAQLTDEYSAAVQEYLYVGSTVLNPSWIPYGELLERGISYIEYGSFENLGDLLSHEIKNYKREERSEQYKNELIKLSSWNTYIPGWRELYQ